MLQNPSFNKSQGGTKVILFLLLNSIIWSVLVYLHFTRSLSHESGAQVLGKVVHTSNVVLRKLSGRFIWEVIAIDSDVYYNDYILTQENSSAMIVLRTGSIIEIESNSLLQIQVHGQDLGLVFNSGILRATGASETDTTKIRLGDSIINIGDAEVTLQRINQQTNVYVESGSVRLNKAKPPPTEKVAAVSQNELGAPKDGQKKKSAKRQKDKPGQVEEDLSEDIIIAGEVLSIVEDKESGRVKKALHQIDILSIHPEPAGLFVLDSRKSKYDILFRWNALVDLDSYELYISSTKTFDKKAIYKTNGFQKKVALSAGTWYWQVTGQRDGQLTASVPHDFRIEGSVGLLLQSPAYNSISKLGEAIRFRWDLERSVPVRLLVAKDKEMRNIIINKLVSGRSFIVNDLDVGRYYWQIEVEYASEQAAYTAQLSKKDKKIIYAFNIVSTSKSKKEVQEEVQKEIPEEEKIIPEQVKLDKVPEKILVPFDKQPEEIIQEQAKIQTQLTIPGTPIPIEKLRSKRLDRIKEAEEEAKEAEEETKRAKEEARQAEKETKRAKEEAKRAKEKAKQAKEKAKQAEEEAKQAKEKAGQKTTERAKKTTERAKKKAEQAKKKAEQAKKKAEQAKKKAEQAKKKAKQAKKKALERKKFLAQAINPLSIGASMPVPLDKSNVVIDYPIAARRNAIQGNIMLELVISKTGKVLNAKIIGRKLGFGLDRAAVKAYKRKRYKPSYDKLNNPIMSKTYQLVQFRLSE